MAGGGEEVIEKGDRGNERDAVPGEFIANRPKDGLGIAAFQFSEHDQRSQIGDQLVEIFGSDLADHHRLRYRLGFEKFDHFPQLPDPHPFDGLDLG